MANSHVTRIAIVGAGDYHNWSDQLNHYTTVIAIDGGYDYCVQMGITPHQILGDADSISDPALITNAKAEFTSNQSTTDLQKALSFISKKYPKHTSTDIQVDLFCVTSHHRLDHTQTAIQALITQPSIATIYTPTQAVHYTTTQLELIEPVGTPVSIVPMNAPLSPTEPLTVELTGLAWSGDEVQLGMNHTSGISNSIATTPATITVHNTTNELAGVLVYTTHTLVII